MKAQQFKVIVNQDQVESFRIEPSHHPWSYGFFTRILFMKLSLENRDDFPRFDGILMKR